MLAVIWRGAYRKLFLLTLREVSLKSLQRYRLSVKWNFFIVFQDRWQEAVNNRRSAHCQKQTIRIPSYLHNHPGKQSRIELGKNLLRELLPTKPSHSEGRPSGVSSNFSIRLRTTSCRISSSNNFIMSLNIISRLSSNHTQKNETRGRRH